MANALTADDASAIGALGWRQGSLASPAMACGATMALAQEDLLVVANHDCDVTNASFSREPHVELLVAHPVPRLDGNHTGGKTARRLHLSIDFPDGPRAFSIDSNERFAVSRRTLLDGPPLSAPYLSPSDRKLLGAWLAKRYDRAAFPDAFNARVKSSLKQVRDCLRAGARSIDALFLAVADEELAPGQTYEVLLRAVMNSSELAEQRQRLDSQRCIDELAGILASCDGIDVVDHALVTDDEITLADMKLLKRWDFDWLSLDDE